MILKGSQVPHIKIKGTPWELGYSYGKQLRERIRGCYEFYTQKLIVNPDLNLESQGHQFLNIIDRFFPHYAKEMEAIARGAELEPWQVSVLNARTEIFIKSMEHFVNECTACFFREEKIFGENWDWMIECLDFIALVEMEREDGHKILMLAEPGIIGKIGLNSKGLGVGLNILHGNQYEIGVPIHVLLRAALDSDTIDQARQTIDSVPFCTFSNILIGDELGNYLDLEFYGRDVKAVNFGNQNPIHTNHYLHDHLDETGNPMYDSSITRIDRVKALERSIPAKGVQKMKQILLDRENGEKAICADFQEHFHYRVGTVSSLIMDLPRRSMLITKGSPLNHEFHEIVLSS